MFSENNSTIRMAHTQPVRLVGRWPPADDAAFFVAWMDQLIADSKAQSDRFANEAERDQVLRLYEEARRYYLDLQ